MWVIVVVVLLDKGDLYVVRVADRIRCGHGYIFCREFIDLVRKVLFLSRVDLLGSRSLFYFPGRDSEGNDIATSFNSSCLISVMFFFVFINTLHVFSFIRMRVYKKLVSHRHVKHMK